MADEIHWWSATRLAAAISAGDVGSREALEHLVSRIEALDTEAKTVGRHLALDQRFEVLTFDLGSTVRYRFSG